MVFAPGKTMHFEVVPHLLPVAADTRVPIETQLLDARQRQLWSVEEEGAGRQREADPGGTHPAAKTKACPTSSSRPSRRPVGRGRCANRCVGNGRSPSGGCRSSSLHRSRLAATAGREFNQVIEIDPASARWWKRSSCRRLSRFSRG